MTIDNKDKKSCSGMRTSGYWKGYKCSAIGKYFKDDKWWCKNHLPVSAGNTDSLKERVEAYKKRWKERDPNALITESAVKQCLRLITDLSKELEAKDARVAELEEALEFTDESCLDAAKLAKKEGRTMNAVFWELKAMKIKAALNKLKDSNNA